MHAHAYILVCCFFAYRSGRAQNGPRHYHPPEDDDDYLHQQHDFPSLDSEISPFPPSRRQMVRDVATAGVLSHQFSREGQLKQDSASSVHEEHRIEGQGKTEPIPTPVFEHHVCSEHVIDTRQHEQYNMKQGALSEAFSREPSVRNGRRQEHPATGVNGALPCFGGPGHVNNTSMGSWGNRATRFIQQRGDSAENPIAFDSQKLSESSKGGPTVTAYYIGLEGSNSADHATVECGDDCTVDTSNMSKSQEAAQRASSNKSNGFKGHSSKDWNTQFIKRWRAVRRTARLQALGFRNIWKLGSPKSESPNHPPELLTDVMPLQHSHNALPAAAHPRTIDCHRVNGLQSGGASMIRDPSLATMLLGEVAEVC